MEKLTILPAIYKTGDILEMYNECWPCWIVVMFFKIKLEDMYFTMLCAHFEGESRDLI